MKNSNWSAKQTKRICEIFFVTTTITAWSFVEFSTRFRDDFNLFKFSSQSTDFLKLNEQAWKHFDPQMTKQAVDDGQKRNRSQWFIANISLWNVNSCLSLSLRKHVSEKGFIYVCCVMSTELRQRCFKQFTCCRQEGSSMKLMEISMPSFNWQGFDLWFVKNFHEKLRQHLNKKALADLQENQRQQDVTESYSFPSFPSLSFFVHLCATSHLFLNLLHIAVRFVSSRLLTLRQRWKFFSFCWGIFLVAFACSSVNRRISMNKSRWQFKLN